MEVSPAVLEFKGPFTHPSTEKLLLTNTSAETLAFKVKTTAPKLYCVRPNASIIQPGESLEVSIISQGLELEPPVGFKCKDKFLLVTLPCPYDDAESKVADLWPSLESEFKATSKKIKVNYLTGQSNTNTSSNTAPVVSSTPASASAQEPVESSASAPFQFLGANVNYSTSPTADNSGAAAAAADSSFVTTHQQEQQQVDSPIDEEKFTSKKTGSSLAALKREQTASSATTPKPPPALSAAETAGFEDYSPSVSTSDSKGGIPIPIVLLIALLAFILGKYIL